MYLFEWLPHEIKEVSGSKLVLFSMPSFCAKVYLSEPTSHFELLLSFFSSVFQFVCYNCLKSPLLGFLKLVQLFWMGQHFCCEKFKIIIKLIINRLDNPLPLLVWPGWWKEMEDAVPRKQKTQELGRWRRNMISSLLF